MKKNLLIVYSSVNPESFLRHYNQSVEVLAFTAMAMLSLDALDIPYKTTEDFYTAEQFRDDVRRLNEEIEGMFLKLDRVSEKHTDFPYAYIGHIYWFLVLFADLLYLEKLSTKLMETYDRKVIFSDLPPNKLKWDNLTYSDLEQTSLSKGLKNKIQILQNLLNAELISEDAEKAVGVPYLIKANAVLRRVPHALRKRIIQKIFPNLKKFCSYNTMNLEKHALFVIQGGYEVGCLRQYMPDYVFLSPDYPGPSQPTDAYDFNDIVLHLTPFLERYFPGMKVHIKELFSSYHKEIVGRIVAWKESFEMLIDLHRPEMLFYSIGANRIRESLFAFIANRKNIPVLYFQHGGSAVFINHPYNKYLERNKRIKKTLILNSSVEVKQADHEGSRCVAFGSISQYQRLKRVQRRLNDRVLYCCGPFPFHYYKDLLVNVNDKDCYDVNRDIIETAKEYSLLLDIKLHPIEEDLGFNYFRRLISNIEYAKAHIIYGIPAELIMRSYGLIVMEYICTAILPNAIALKIPIVLYLKDQRVVNRHVYKDLKKRCYIVQNRDELREVLNRYAEGNLDSKWSEEIVDRYIYPVNNGDPGPNIAAYIRSSELIS
jgi:hypothetical protein